MLRLYADRLHLIISGYKTKVTCILRSRENAQLRGSTNTPDFAQQLLYQKNPGTRPTCSVHAPDEPLHYLGVFIG
eukprot:1158207-Pelagomonas_calceolata.AAC.1